MTTLAIDKLWRFLQSLSLTASNERWLADWLLESANAKTAKDEQAEEATWAQHPLSPKIAGLSLKNRKPVADNIEDTLQESLEEKYK